VAVPQGGRLQPTGEVGALRRLLPRGRLRLRGTYPVLSITPFACLLAILDRSIVVLY
jgi:hypothetical protein